MGIDENTHNAQALSQCYRLASEYETSEGASNILRARANYVEAIRNINDYEEGRGLPSSVQVEFTRIIGLLSKEGYLASDNNGGYSQDINAAISILPECMEKYYLRAIVAFRTDNGIDAVNEAVTNLKKALEYSPNDPRCLHMLEVIRSAGTK